MGHEVESAARERVLVVAERLFGERGYDSVTLRDIAQALGIRQASLYHHAPGGKEQLFVEVTERALTRHQRHIERLLAAHPEDLGAQLTAVAGWLLSQPPVDLPRLVRSDLAAISQEHARELRQVTLDSVVVPLERACVAARERGEVDFARGTGWERALAGSFLAIVDHARIAPQLGPLPPATIVDGMIAVLLNGLRPR